MSIESLSVIDGRYKKSTKELADIFSEYALIKKRVFVELKWLEFLLSDLQLSDIRLKPADLEKIESIYKNFDITEAEKVKKIEKKTNHDVKAAEYYIKESLESLGLGFVKEWIHFACTSEDINNTSYALMIKKGVRVACKYIEKILSKTEKLAKNYKAIPMLSRTHGQPATPTTVGKEFIDFAAKIKRELSTLEKTEPCAKMNGASGNYNAHHFVFPETDWIEASEKFLSNYLGLAPSLYTTQVNQYNYISEILHCLIRTASVIIDLDRDMWGYISLEYFKQKVNDAEVSSSTMPHKVNPIDFENSEGNMGIAISIAEHIAVKLLNSRFQRDLTDSTVLRNIGTIFGYFIIGIESAIRGLEKIEVNKETLQNDLEKNIALLAEPIQTAMRVAQEEAPYERLKSITRGKKITKESLYNFIDSLDNTSEEMKKRMKSLTPSSYIGLAEKLVDRYFS